MIGLVALDKMENVVKYIKISSPPSLTPMVGNPLRGVELNQPPAFKSPTSLSMGSETVRSGRDTAYKEAMSLFVGKKRLSVL